jgi:hypothetical protein
LAGLEGDVVTAEARLAESLDLARILGDKRGIASALGALGSVLFQHIDILRSIAPFEEAASLMRELGDLRQTAFLLAYLASAVSVQGDLERGESLVAESEALLLSLGDTCSFEMDFLLLIQGWLALLAGDFDRAEERLTATLELGRALDSKGILSVTLGFLGELALVQGVEAVAVGHFCEGLILGWEAGYPVGIVLNLKGLVWVGSRREEFILTARFLGALDSLEGRVLQRMPGLVSAAHEANIARVRAALGEDAFVAEWETGRARPLEEVIAEAVTTFAPETQASPNPGAR